MMTRSVACGGKFRQDPNEQSFIRARRLVACGQGLIGAILLCVLLQGCSMTRGTDAEAALFAALFDVPRGTCKQLKAQLLAEIEGIKIAKRKADEAFIAENEASPKATQQPPSSRKHDPLAALRDWTKKSQDAEKLNAALEERHCRTVDIDAATK
jgi:hypothetical protein